MTTVSLEFHPQSEMLIVSGANSSITRHPLFANYFRQSRGVVASDGGLHIPTSSDSLTYRYQNLGKILQSIGVQIEQGNNVSNLLERVENDERNFALFSKEANEIWHRHIETSAFQNFVKIIQDNCIGRTFYRKQLLSAFHLAFAQNACNFSVPGAGKTSIVYAAYTYLKSLSLDSGKSVTRLLIVGPLSAFKAWEDEYKEIFQRSPRSCRISGALPATERFDILREVRFTSRSIEIVLTSYPTLASSEADFKAFLTNPNHRTMMVLDEAHYIKRDDGIWAAAALRLAPLAASRVVLTGTPAPNGYEDLSNLFKFIYPARNIVGFPAASLKAMTDGAIPQAVPELKSNIQPFYTRIKKSDLGLPEAEELRIPVPLGNLHERIYRSIERKIVPQLRMDINNSTSPIRVKARLIRLRQASTNPELLLRPLEEEGVFDTGGTGDFSLSELELTDLIKSFRAETDLERLSVCETLAEKIIREQGKVLIWSYFLGNLDRLKRLLVPRAPFVEVLTGATPVSGGEIDDESTLGTREDIINRFHNTVGSAILIANPQAVGESISLHKACRSAIYFDRDFNAGRFIQSKDRIHRYNPLGGGPVKYYHLLSHGTVDDDINLRLLIKERRLAGLVDSDEIPLFMTGEDDELADVRLILESYERRKTI